MTSLDWNMLAAKFYDFKKEADKHGFYTPELAGMEHSLDIMRPYQDSEELRKKTSSGFVSKIQGVVKDIKSWTMSKPVSPKFDDNDELVHA